MYLYERTKVVSRFSWDFVWALFFYKQQDEKTMKYTKNAFHEGLNLKGLILYEAIYQIGDAANLLVLENIVLVLRDPIECPFGWLKARWGFLKLTIALQLENVPAVISSCFVLHNFCEINQCGVDPDLVRKLAELH